MEKQLTVRDFKMWFEGVIDANPDDWIPNKDQWSKIKQKIDQLIETVALTQTPVQKTTSPVFSTLPTEVRTARPEEVPKEVPKEVPSSALGGMSIQSGQPLSPSRSKELNVVRSPNDTVVKVDEQFYDSPFV